jgi:hypothetical protein
MGISAVNSTPHQGTNCQLLREQENMIMVWNNIWEFTHILVVSISCTRLQSFCIASDSSCPTLVYIACTIWKEHISVY